MRTISYVIDPDGDVELVLREPNSHQIIPEIHGNGLATQGKLNEKRLDLIEQIQEGLQDVHDTLHQEPECVRGDSLRSSLALGVLARMVYQHEHADPPFIAPFNGYSVYRSLWLVKECTKPMPQHGSFGPYVPRYIDLNDRRTYPCSIKGRMTPGLEKVEGELCRMPLADFNDSSCS
ncbi:hypothetical protein J7337_001655 [Fusarium musae]|uniref:Uncharacterized protein n=1 Tax=Fusarium musae TaxID=1042133 RepID=A0A9P8DU99_9HYPO|nr:hypothetical protein J7337_001655 [Fusarium musae]KAG9508095.1 hypothetical protein J7337_001655 [Fusarium musae]